MPRKGGKTMKKKGVKKGGYYGFSGALGTGAPAWSRGSEMGDFAISSRGGNTQYGARRHKGSKKGKKTMKKRMRGGGKFGGVSASFQGTGERGIANYKGIITRDGTGSAAGGSFNNFGAQPGSGYGSFVKAV
jgi:hypothetical protein